MTPLVLLPGMMCDARIFAPQINALSAHRAVHVAPIGAQDTVQTLAAETLAHAPPHFALAGLSMGGIVAMEMLRQAPDRISHLALLDTNHRAESKSKQALRKPQIDRAQNGELRTIMRDEMKPNYLADGPNQGAILDLCMAMAETLGADVFARQSRALRDRPNQTETLRHCHARTLVLCGAEDALCPPDRHRDMRALIPNATLTIIKDAGHLPTLEQPSQTNQALQSWLSL